MHLSLSESLADLSLYTAPYIIRKYKGEIVYAGGDDVVAVFPVATALPAAQETRDFYRSSFVKRNPDGSVEKCASSYRPCTGERFLIHPGEAATMSCAVVFAVGGEKAGELFTFARRMLDEEAKDKAGRDAIAVVLKNPDGNENIISRKWEDEKGCRLVDLLMRAARDASNSSAQDTPDEISALVHFLSGFTGTGKQT